MQIDALKWRLSNKLCGDEMKWKLRLLLSEFEERLEKVEG